jgi:molecular chaperone DnaK (HSP70)
MVEEEEKYKNDDAIVRERDEAKNILEEQIYLYKNKASSVDDSVKKEMNAVINNYETWLTNNVNEDKETYMDKIKELHDKMSLFESTSTEKHFNKANASDEEDDGIPEPKIDEID